MLSPRLNSKIRFIFWCESRKKLNVNKNPFLNMFCIIQKYSFIFLAGSMPLKYPCQTTNICISLRIFSKGFKFKNTLGLVILDILIRVLKRTCNVSSIAIVRTNGQKNWSILIIMRHFKNHRMLLQSTVQGVHLIVAYQPTILFALRTATASYLV